jgi:hypothetical protein
LQLKVIINGQNQLQVFKSLNADIFQPALWDIQDSYDFPFHTRTPFLLLPDFSFPFSTSVPCHFLSSQGNDFFIGVPVISMLEVTHKKGLQKLLQIAGWII